MCSPTSEVFFDAQKRKQRDLSSLEQKIKNKRERKYIREIIENVSNNEPKINEVIMKGTRLPPKTMTSLAMALIGNTHVQVLFLQNNEITPIGAQILASALQANTHLEHLWLGENQVCSAGVSAIATALYKNKTLKTLGLSNNGITRDGALSLLDALRKNRSIEGVCLVGNSIDPKLEALIHECAARNKRRKLHMSKSVQKDRSQKHKKMDRLRSSEDDKSDHNDQLFYSKESTLDPIKEEAEAESDFESCDVARQNVPKRVSKKRMGNGRKVGTV